jgi:catechol 2,3-dioxygenase-like lactoylglutathione lyase family enzyme
MSASTRMIAGVDFVAIPTHDLNAAIAFYGGTLGMPRSMYIEGKPFAEFEAGSLTLSVIEPEQMGLEFALNRNHIALHVDDVASAHSELEARGVAFEGEILDTGVCHMAFFADPDGNALMLHHRYAPREAQA